MAETDDLTLLRDFAKTSSETAFAALVERHLSLVYSTALRYLGKPDAAEEATQAVFIILARKARVLGPRTILPGWLHHTTRLTAANYRRTEIRRLKREQEAAMQAPLNEPDPATWRQIAPLLDDALAKLGAADRDAIVLRFFHNQPLREVGAALGTSEDAAKMRVNRALDKLRQYFTRRGVSATTAAIGLAITTNALQAAPVALSQSVVAAAVTQSAAASLSTLTLVKSVLKIMAWTKTKIAATASAVLLATTAATTTAVYHHYHTPPPQTGSFNLPTGTVKPKIVYGHHNGILLASDGSLWSWGDEDLGWRVLGLNNPKLRNTVSLRRIGTDKDWVDIAASYCHCLALKQNGTLWAWGGNYAHQLGDGTTAKDQPEPVPSVEGNDWRQIAAGGTHSLALKKDGTLWAWGQNVGPGMIGLGATNKFFAEATQIGTGTNWTKIWTRNIQTVAQQTDGSLWFWGLLNGEDNGPKFKNPTAISPDTNWAEVFFGDSTMFAIKTDGTLWCWGRLADVFSPGQGDPKLLKPAQVGIETNWIAGEATGGFYLLLKKRDGTFWVSDASERRIVKPESEYKPVKFQPINLPQNIVAFAAAGDDRGIVLTSEGETWTWGTVYGEYPPPYWDQSLAKWKTLLQEPRVVSKPWRLAHIDTPN